MSGCRRCRIDLLHCHGTLVRHEDGSWECTADDCTGDVVAHDLVLACGQAWAVCCGAAAELGERLAS